MDWEYRSKSLIDRFRYQSQEISVDDLRVVADAARDINEWLRDILPIGPEVVDQLTYGQAFSYFADHRPSDSRVIKGAMYTNAAWWVIPSKEEQGCC
jgi:hypothetical protein